MPTREISRDEWVSFFNYFSGLHEGWLVNVEEVGENIGTEVEVEGLPLRGINADLKDKEDAVAITLGHDAHDNVDHIIENVAHVRLTQTDESEDEEVQIESEDGTITLVRFRATVLPETLDDAIM